MSKVYRNQCILQLDLDSIFQIMYSIYIDIDIYTYIYIIKIENKSETPNTFSPKHCRQGILLKRKHLTGGLLTTSKI